ncbi:hypothetical protein HYW32_01445 [Candidatus Berkelbacteria bacterium]|nr:hypothetical protein [Candidatus Berkelbacteria bacterium]
MEIYLSDKQVRVLVAVAKASSFGRYLYPQWRGAIVYDDGKSEVWEVTWQNPSNLNRWRLRGVIQQNLLEKVLGRKAELPTLGTAFYCCGLEPQQALDFRKKIQAKKQPLADLPDLQVVVRRNPTSRR